MYLKRLEIQGFKSFAQKTALEFESGMTSIVGPNGSGKSNVADSLRWVLGEQSIRLMRGKKSDDVIFAGSDKKVRHSFAEVVATFDNRDHKIPLDYAEVSIGRRIDRSGESEYLLNGNRVRLLDIIDLVLKSNIGTSRYTVIGQGTIDQMIFAGPAEVKNLIDEASGVKSYYNKREKTLRRLEQAAQNLMRSEDLISELEPRVKSLRRLAKRMEAREEVQKELQTYQKEFLGASYWQLQNSINDLQNQINGLLQKRTAMENEIAGHLKKIEQHEADSSEGFADFQDQQRELSRLQSEKNQFLENLSLIRGKMQSQKTGSAGDAQSLQVALHSAEQQLADLNKQISAAELEISSSTEASKSAQLHLAELNGTLDKLYAGLSAPAAGNWPDLQKEFADFDRQLETFSQDIANTQDLSQVPQLVEAFRQQWHQFKRNAETLATHPASTQGTCSRSCGICPKKRSVDCRKQYFVREPVKRRKNP